MFSYDLTESFRIVYPGAENAINPNSVDAIPMTTSDGLYDPLVAIGLRVTVADGNVVILTNGEGYPLEYRQGDLTDRPTLVLGKSPTSGEWYVLPWLGHY